VSTSDYGFHGSYLPDDIVFLLKPIDFPYTEVAEKELLIQRGKKHYSEMLSPEYRPSPQYLDLFHRALADNRRRFAMHLWNLAARLAGRDELTLVSLARAGTPVGVLLKRILRECLGREVAHYSLSIIRDRGLDQNALRYILARHGDHSIAFIDGWTGKGVISRELRRAVEAFNAAEGTRISPDLHVVADISGNAAVAAAQDDYLIPSALLNATINGLISRSILNDDYLGPADFHGCRYFGELAEEDLSLWYVEQIMAEITELRQAGYRAQACVTEQARRARQAESEAFVREMLARYRIGQVNYLKPGLGEAIRVLLRRVPERILLRDASLPEVQPFLQLAGEKGVPVDQLTEMPYTAVGIIRSA
jgi:hypothetical protein